MESSKVRIRPLRFAFLVDPRDKVNLKVVFEINSNLWGGCYNVIIPLFKRVPAHYKRPHDILPPAKLTGTTTFGDGVDELESIFVQVVAYRPQVDPVVAPSAVIPRHKVIGRDEALFGEMDAGLGPDLLSSRPESLAGRPRLNLGAFACVASALAFITERIARTATWMPSFEMKHPDGSSFEADFGLFAKPHFFEHASMPRLFWVSVSRLTRSSLRTLPAREKRRSYSRAPAVRFRVGSSLPNGASAIDR